MRRPGTSLMLLSVSVLNRGWPACPYTARDLNGWVEIATSEMLLKYKLESGAFTAENLTITWTDKAGAHAWKPGAVDDKNFGGRARRHCGTPRRQAMNQVRYRATVIFS